MEKFRVAWVHPVTGKKHHGEWSKDKKNIEAWVSFGNKEYPELCHFIESNHESQESGLKLENLFERYNNEDDLHERQKIEELIMLAVQQTRKYSDDACSLSVIHASVIEQHEFPVISVTLKNKGLENKHITDCLITFQNKVTIIELMAPQSKVLEPLTVWDIKIPSSHEIDKFLHHRFHPHRVIQVGAKEAITIDIRFSYESEGEIYSMSRSNILLLKADFITEDGDSASTEFIEL